MALTRLYQFDTGTVLAESDIEGEFDQIYGSSLSLVSPWTGNMAAGGNLLTGLSLGSVSGPSLQFTGDTNTGVYSSAADTVDVATGGVRAASFGASFLLSAVPEDARTNSVDVAGEVRSTTSGTPAAGIGVGLLFSAESADENPSNFGRLDFAATDIGAGTEDTYASVLLRVAGRALDEKYRFGSTAGDGFTAIFAHANTADRTYTLPDSDATLGYPTRVTQDVATSQTTTSTSYTDLATGGPSTAMSPGRSADHVIVGMATISNSSTENTYISVAIAGAAAAEAEAAQHNGTTAASKTFHALAAAVADGQTHNMKYRVDAGTGTYLRRRLTAWTVS